MKPITIFWPTCPLVSGLYYLLVKEVPVHQRLSGYVKMELGLKKSMAALLMPPSEFLQGMGWRWLSVTYVFGFIALNAYGNHIKFQNQLNQFQRS